MRVLLTQSEHALGGLEPALLVLGHEVVRWPLIRTVPLADARARAQAGALGECRWLLFSSIAAVAAWVSSGQEPRAGQLYGAVGPGTAAALRAVGIIPTLVAGGDALSLAADFLAHPVATGPVGLPLGDRSSATLRVALEGCGYEVVTAVLYRTETLVPPAFDSPASYPDAVVLASPSAASALPAAIASHAVLVAIGDTTAAAVQACGGRCLSASSPTVAGVVESLRTVHESLLEGDA